MGCKELIESLKKAADERLRQLWQDAEDEAGKIQAAGARKLNQLSDEMNRKQALQSADCVNRAVSEAAARARGMRLAAEQELAGRLYRAAQEMLPALRNGGGEALFRSLARELPPMSWETVQVNPDDAALAKELFPGARISQDARISGGMEASARNGAVTVSNTLEKRLERAWSDLQPELIRDAYREVKDEASAAAAGGPGIPGGIPDRADQRQAVAPDR